MLNPNNSSSGIGITLMGSTIIAGDVTLNGTGSAGGISLTTSVLSLIN